MSLAVEAARASTAIGVLTGTRVKNQRLASDHRFFTIMTLATLALKDQPAVPHNC
jgi:hypothetical protein